MASRFLLVPSSWARIAFDVCDPVLRETKVLDYAQLERAVRVSTGKLVKTPKDQLMHEPGLVVAVVSPTSVSPACA